MSDAEPLQQDDIGADPMEATIREAYKGMNAEGTIGSDEPNEAVIGEEPEAQPDRPRDEHGRFKPKEEQEAQTPVETVDETPAEEPVEEEAPEGEEEPSPYDTPPSSWKKEAAADWSLIPAGVRQEIHRREQNMLDGIQQYKGAADFGHTLYKEFQPYEPMLRALNTNPAEATRQMLNQEYILRQGTPEQKGQLIAEAIQAYGIDPNLIRLEQGGSQVPPELQQALTPLQQEVDRLKQELDQQRSQAQQATEAATRAQREDVSQEVEGFRSALDDSGKLKNPYFEQVRDDMSALLANGRASGLQDAYDKAVWANPEVRSKLIAQQRKAEREAAAKKAAEAKKAAAANVQDQGSLPGKEATGTMEDTIREQYRKLTGQA